MGEEKEIINRVAKSGLIQLDMADLFPKEEVVVYDIAQNLWQGIALKEKDFREFIKSNEWSKYADQHVAIICTVDAIIPSWAYMLLASALTGIAKSIDFGSNSEVENKLLIENIRQLDLREYTDARVVIKGCSNRVVPEEAWIALTTHLQPVAKSILFGEPCSTVPVYKKRS